MFFQSIQSVIILLLIISVGFILQEQKWFHETFSSGMSALIMKIALPSAIFISVLKYLKKEDLFRLSSSLGYTFIAIAIDYFLAIVLVKMCKVRSGRKGTVINTFANANTVSIGLPLNLALFGEKSLPFFLIYYLSNTASTWAVGIFFIQNDATNPGEVQKKKFNWKQLFPAPLVSFFVAIGFLVANIKVPFVIHATINYLGELVTPLSLIYVGTVLSKSKLSSIRLDKDTSLALIGRFIIAPATMIVVILAATAFINTPIDPMLKQTLIVQSATPALVVLPILVTEARGDVPFATNIVTLSSILFAFVVPIIMYFIKYF